MSGDASTTGPYALSRTYEPRPGATDELLDASGQLHPRWRTLFGQVEPLGRFELEQRWDKARHLLHENGVSYNVYGDPQGQDRPWRLSPLPVVVSADDFQKIESGLQQRARLLDAVLRDIYGPQRALVEGLLPPELIFGNPGFLRPCHHLHTPHGRMLSFYAADLVRDPSGGFSVLVDQTQVPSGSGYALENRLIISGVLSEAFRTCNVERLALYFHAVRSMLRSLSPHNRDNPRVVLLTPGPYNASYFEQAYLAQYLGYTLVSGEDLTVRNNRVYLKTLGGLQLVDVILRRVSDDFCDSLELRPDSMLGVPGLVQAARVGNVAIASPLGSGVLQTPAILPYLPRLCEHLLGETLAMPSVASWWCGDPAALAEGVTHFDDAVVKPTFAGSYRKPVLTAQLTTAARRELLEKIRNSPQRYVIQQRAAGSTVPVLADGRLVPRTWVMRCFAVAGPSEYVVMSGALSRIADSSEGTELSLQRGAGSADTWVLGDGASASFSLLPSSHRPIELSRGGSDLPSRATDNLYWLGRYAERAEAVARLCRAISARLIDLTDDREYKSRDDLHALLQTLSAQTALSEPGAPPQEQALDLSQATAQLLDAVFESNSEGALKTVVESALRAGRLVRDRISLDTWRILAALDDELAAGHKAQPIDPLGAAHEVLGRVVLRLAAFSGLVMDSMTRGHAWRFLDLGRRIERALSLLTLLRSGLDHNARREETLLEIMLEVADSSMTYRRRYLASVQVAPVVDLLLTDETNPRSVVYQLQAIHEHIADLPNSSTAIRSPQERLALELLTELKLADVVNASEADASGDRPRLQRLLVQMAEGIPALSDSLSNRYLAHATPTRHLQSSRTDWKGVDDGSGGSP